MKSTGIVRKVDELGRIVLPIELRRTMGIEVKDALEIYVDGDHIVLKKYEPSCVFCTVANRHAIVSMGTVPVSVQPDGTAHKRTASISPLIHLRRMVYTSRISGSISHFSRKSNRFPPMPDDRSK